MNLYDYLLANARADRVAVISGATQVRYGELVESAESIAATLAGGGANKGDRVGIVADNSPFWIASYLAVLKAGMVAVPFPGRLTPDNFAHLASLTGCRTVCIDRKHYAKYQPALLTGSRAILSDGPPDEDTPVRTDSIVSPARGGYSTVDVDVRNDLAALMFTSGSTGTPNAVKVSHQNIIANTTSIVEALGLDVSDRIMVVLPFDYCFGTSLLHTHLRVGASLVLHNAFQYTEDVLNQMDRHECTEIAGVPLIYQRLLRNSTMTRRPWRHLRLAQQAGGKLADVFIREFLASMPDTQLYVMYGQTEATARLSYLPPDRLKDKLGSIGRGLPGVTLKVVDAEGVPAAPGEVGEIVAEGDNITLGYWAPDSTKDNFQKGHLRTGDLAQVDSEGFIYIVGRSGDFVKPKGHRISCREIEDVLVGMPQIVEVAVRGVPDLEIGEAVKAYIVTTDGKELAPAQVRQFCRGKLEDYAVPRHFTFMRELPRNASQKVLKALLPT